MTAVDRLRIRRGIDPQDERGDEPLRFASLLGEGVVPDDGPLQVLSAIRDAFSRRVVERRRSRPVVTPPSQDSPRHAQDPNR